LQGLKITTDNVSYLAFKGVPYAEPPIGSSRFQDADRKKNWIGIRNATEHGNFCPNKFGFANLSQQSGGSEDCLFLNVYTPSLDGKRAVMFYIHGGSFVSGNGDSLIYGPDHLVGEDVVLVTINYRYGPFGFLSTNDKYAPGNQGLKDILLALEWVQKNIKKFGGNPSKVTIFGSAAVHYLMLSDLSDGLFQQAILHSESALMPQLFQPNPLNSAETLARRLKLDFNSTEELVEKLQEIDFQKIVNIEEPLFDQGVPFGLRPIEYAPVVDAFSFRSINSTCFSGNMKSAGSREKFLTASPTARMVNDQFRDIPIMVGNTNFEGMFVSNHLLSKDSRGRAAKVIDFYNKDDNRFPNSEFVVPLSFGLQSSTWDETVPIIKEIEKLYFNGKDFYSEDGYIDYWLKLYTDEMFRFPLNRVAKFHANSSTQPIYYYDFEFDGLLGLMKQQLGLKNKGYVGATNGDELLYLFKTSLPGFEADANSTIVQKRMTKMWANFAKLG
jgi:bile salt-stimulated lipase